ncbi:MAG: hypothetical protein HZR80_12015 [Candidatus Heimdallarchaeota archaeon]
MKIENLIKLGGSVTENRSVKELKELGKSIYKNFQSSKNFVIVPGGGVFADFVRKTQDVYGIDDESVHWMAIQAMDQNALLLRNFIPNSYLIDFNTSDFPKKVSNDKLPILNVLQYMRLESTLDKSWDTTSDAIAAEIACQLEVKRLIFVKDIDGVFVKDKFRKEITLDELEQLESSPIDKITPRILLNQNLKVYIVNGLYPKRINELIKEKEDTIATEIICKKVA